MDTLRCTRGASAHKQTTWRQRNCDVLEVSRGSSLGVRRGKQTAGLCSGTQAKQVVSFRFLPRRHDLHDPRHKRRRPRPPRRLPRSGTGARRGCRLGRPGPGPGRRNREGQVLCRPAACRGRPTLPRAHAQACDATLRRALSPKAGVHARHASCTHPPAGLSPPAFCSLCSATGPRSDAARPAGTYTLRAREYSSPPGSSVFFSTPSSERGPWIRILIFESNVCKHRCRSFEIRNPDFDFKRTDSENETTPRIDLFSAMRREYGLWMAKRTRSSLYHSSTRTAHSTPRSPSAPRAFRVYYLRRRRRRRRRGPPRGASSQV
jgi:hypothetical protein